MMENKSTGVTVFTVMVKKVCSTQFDGTDRNNRVFKKLTDKLLQLRLDINKLFQLMPEKPENRLCAGSVTLTNIRKHKDSLLSSVNREARLPGVQNGPELTTSLVKSPKYSIQTDYSIYSNLLLELQMKTEFLISQTAKQTHNEH